VSQLQTQSRANNQGRSGQAVDPAKYAEATGRWTRIRQEASAAYEWMTGQDVARELARIDLPLSTYTQWYWKIDLHNLLHFLSLRLDPHAQDEIRRYAAEISKLVRLVTPTAYEAFEDFQLGAVTLSRREQRAVRSLLDGASIGAACAAAGLELRREDGTPRVSGEGPEFLEKLERLRSATAD